MGQSTLSEHTVLLLVVENVATAVGVAQISLPTFPVVEPSLLRSMML